MENFFWGYVKDFGYATPISDMNELKTTIGGAIPTIAGEKLANIWAEIEFWLNVLWATNLS